MVDILQKVYLKRSAIILMLVLMPLIYAGCLQEPILDIKKADQVSKPWTRWWWMGSSVTKQGITQHLEAFKEISLGGVEIVPIYGERGDEQNFIPYLSEKWIEMLLHTLREADRLNLGVDITLGSGWPYGGPWISEQYAARRYSELFDQEGEQTGQRVKRAAPGAFGLVVDHLNPDAMRHFLSRFDSVLAIIKKEKLPLRAIFNDSYEVYGADWTPDFKENFHEKRGYPFPDNLFSSNDSANIDNLSSWHDYHYTISELVYETVGETIFEWCERHNLQYRYQAHGSPSNILDLYGLASIPETECFGSSTFNIPLVPYDKDYDELQFARPDPLIYKFASSPAHILAKPLISSETATWLADHFKVSLSQVKPQVDELFTSGINHIFYHGITYSPFEKDFPGRLFYASTNFGPGSALWNHLDDLNHYISNCQSVLQETNPDNDVLLYFPVHDLWNNKGQDGNLIMQSVHNPDAWLYNTPFGHTARTLYDTGYAFDYVSDKQISLLAKNYKVSPKVYKALIVPSCKFIPIETLLKVIELQQKGIQILFLERYPEYVPGRQALHDSKKQLNGSIKSAGFEKPVPNDIESISKALAEGGIYPESIKKEGLLYIRKSHNNGYVYFISNLGNMDYDDNFSLSRKYKSIEIYDPITEARGKAQIIHKENDTQVRLQMGSGESIFLFTYDSDIEQIPWKYIQSSTEFMEFKHGWSISIDDKLEEYNIDSLLNWTDIPFDWMTYYSGKGFYKITFDFDIENTRADAIILDLGDLRNMASAWLNDKMVGNFWCVPFRTTIPITDFSTTNTLVIEVTNLDANQMIKMDMENIPWKNFYDINIVDIRYKPFNASKWDPIPSGLLGPVRLKPVSYN